LREGRKKFELGPPTRRLHPRRWSRGPHLPAKPSLANSKSTSPHRRRHHLERARPTNCTRTPARPHARPNNGRRRPQDRGAHPAGHAPHERSPAQREGTTPTLALTLALRPTSALHLQRGSTCRHVPCATIRSLAAASCAHLQARHQDYAVLTIHASGTAASPRCSSAPASASASASSSQSSSSGAVPGPPLSASDSAPDDRGKSATMLVHRAV
jgi:hypothetical protein